jgi:hypothetical protein
VNPLMEEMGAKNQAPYQAENDPSEVTSMSEWDSHDQMHAAPEKYGDQFNDDAGTRRDRVGDPNLASEDVGQGRS